MDPATIFSMPLFVWAGRDCLICFSAPILGRCLVEGFRRTLQQGEAKQGAPCRLLSLPEAAGLNSQPTAAPRPGLEGSLGALRLRDAASGLELVEDTAKRGHCFHHKAWAGHE